MAGTIETKKANKALLLKKAPGYANITALAKGEGITPKSIHRYCQQDGLFKKNLNKILGTNVVRIDIENDRPSIGIGYKAKAKLRLVTNDSSKPNVNVKGVKGVAKADEIFANSGYKIDKKLPVIEQTVRKNVTHNQTVFQNKKVTIEVADIPTKRRTVEQKIYLGFKVCEAVEKGSAVIDACLACSVAVNSFWRWTNPTAPEYIEEVGLRYLQAKAHLNYVETESLITLGRAALKNSLVDREITETRRFGTVSKGGVVTPRNVVQSTHTQTPQASQIRFVLERVDPTFAPKDDSKKADVDLEYTPIEVLHEEYEETLKKIEAAKNMPIGEEED